MKKFKVLNGKFYFNNQIFKAGDVVETDLILDGVYRNKFILISDEKNVHPEDDKIESEKKISESVKQKRRTKQT